jgi:BON domain
MGALTRRRGLWFVVFAAIGMIGCTNEDTDHLARVGHKVAEKAATALGNADGKLLSTFPAVGGDATQPTLSGRVSARLRWDKTLAEVKIEVNESGTTVELKGTVPEQAQKQRALELAESTEGVQKVTDKLELAGKEQGKDP